MSTLPEKFAYNVLCEHKALQVMNIHFVSATPRTGVANMDPESYSPAEFHSNHNQAHLNKLATV